MIKILLVEDNVVVRTSMAGLIQMKDGLEITAEAEDGQAAIELLTGGLKVDLVLADVNMPRMDGIELTEKIFMFDEQLKVIILTMHDKRTFLNRAFAAGAKGYLLKNGDMDELYAAIEKVLQGETVIGSDVGSNEG